MFNSKKNQAKAEAAAKELEAHVKKLLPEVTYEITATKGSKTVKKSNK